MNKKIRQLLDHQEDNHMLPFFWQHGEDEATLREYMKAIYDSNIRAVCIESRPHPDFCGPKWWQDMDIILDEARKREMKVWILDDSHFPTGYANGALKDKPDELCRQSIVCRIADSEEEAASEEFRHPKPPVPTAIDKIAGEKNPRVFSDDRQLGTFRMPNGKIAVLILSRNLGVHRSYINMMDRESCRVQIDAVYEPHFAHYANDFGKTIAGFFSDEPELGNGHLFRQGNVLGSDPDMDLPWSRELENELKLHLGNLFPGQLWRLWYSGNGEPDPEGHVTDPFTAEIRYLYMDAVTRLVEQDFSVQIGKWCWEHGVSYIGHLIEDNDQHARTGTSLGHYFRGLAGQDMAGIDDIGGQVMPQGEDTDVQGQIFGNRTGEFFHYMLGSLASSAAAIEPLKCGNAMCEIFGAYGWSEGVHLEKYLLDHFLVRGINYFVPHAFSPKAFPDPDCPPHFYAHGNNPQYRHFGTLMKYGNRVSTLLSGGRHTAPAAVIYHAEAEWTGKCMPSHKVGHQLMDAGIGFDYLPLDVFEEDRYHLSIGDGVLKVNTQEYKAVIVPESQYITEAFASAAAVLEEAGIPVIFIESRPEGVVGICMDEMAFEKNIKSCSMLPLSGLVPFLISRKIPEFTLIPADSRLRCLHYAEADGSFVYMLVNEGTKPWQGGIRFEGSDSVLRYDAWSNRLFAVDTDHLTVEPLHSVFLVSGMNPAEAESAPLSACARQPVSFETKWKRSICRSIDYPVFKKEKEILLPDTLAEEEPDFSGFVRYENTFLSEQAEYLLEITDACEGVEVFLDEESLGIQIVPPYRYEVPVPSAGRHSVRIEVATTLSREMAKQPGFMGKAVPSAALSGITGEVYLSKRS